MQTVHEEPLPGIKNSKFKEVVCKVMLDYRMKQLQQHYTKELSDALEGLEQSYHSKRNEAFEKLVATYLYYTDIDNISRMAIYYLPFPRAMTFEHTKKADN